jgi:hypothetical protein
MKTVRLVEIFVSCPSDCKTVRDRFVKAANEMNMELRGTNAPVRLEVVHLDNAVFSSIGDTGQSVIDEQIGQYDVYIGLMKNKFGTAVGKFGSGTEHEYNAAKALHSKGGCDIAFLFDDKAKSKRGEDPDTLIQLGESLKKVAAFKAGLHKDGVLTFNCPTPEEFERQFRGIANKAITRAKGTTTPQKLAEAALADIIR